MYFLVTQIFAISREKPIFLDFYLVPLSLFLKKKLKISYSMSTDDKFSHVYLSGKEKTSSSMLKILSYWLLDWMISDKKYIVIHKRLHNSLYIMCLFFKLWHYLVLLFHCFLSNRIIIYLDVISLMISMFEICRVKFQNAHLILRLTVNKILWFLDKKIHKSME